MIAARGHRQNEWKTAIENSERLGWLGWLAFSRNIGRGFGGGADCGRRTQVPTFSDSWQISQKMTLTNSRTTRLSNLLPDVNKLLQDEAKHNSFLQKTLQV